MALCLFRFSVEDSMNTNATVVASWWMQTRLAYVLSLLLGLILMVSTAMFGFDDIARDGDAFALGWVLYLALLVWSADVQITRGGALCQDTGYLNRIFARLFFSGVGVLGVIILNALVEPLVLHKILGALAVPTFGMFWLHAWLLFKLPQK